MSSDRVTKSLHKGEGTGSPQHVTRFYAEEACAEIRVTPKTESTYEGNSAFVLEGYEQQQDSENSVFEHAVSANGQSPESDGTIKIRIRPGDGDGEVPLKKRLKGLRYRLLHRPLGEDKEACEYPLFEHASFEQVWGPEPMAAFDEVAFAETADVKPYKNRLVPDETTLHGEKTKSLRTHEASVKVENDDGKWTEENERRPRWAYAFSVTEAKDGSNYVTIHEWKADENGKLARVDAEAGPSDDRTPEDAAQGGALLPTRWILAGPSAPDEQAHTVPEYGFWLSQEKLPAERLEYIEQVLSEGGATRFMPVEPLDPALHKIETPSGGPEWTRTVLLADLFAALQHRYEQFRDPLNRLHTITSEAAPLRATADIAKSLSTSSNGTVRSGVQEAAVPAQLKRVETEADVGPQYRLQPFRREEMRQGASGPLWKTWRAEYQEQVEALREEADDAAQRVVELFERDTFKAAYVDYELGDDKSRMRADYLAGRARRGLSTVSSGRKYLASLYKSSRGRYPGTTTLTASVNLLDVLWKEGRKTTKGTVSTFVEIAGHAAAQADGPDEDLQEMARLIRTALEMSEGAVDDGGGAITIGEMVKITGFDKPITPSTDGRRYLAEIQESLLKQRVQTMRAEQRLENWTHHRTTVGGVLELINVVNAALNAGAVAEDLREKRLREGQALTSLLTFVLDESRTRVEQSMKRQQARSGGQSLDDLAKGGGGKMAMAVKGLRFAVLTGLAIGATIEIVLAHRAIEESVEEYDYDAVRGQAAMLGGSLAMTIGFAVALIKSDFVFLSLGGTGWGLIIGVLFFAAGAILLYLADPTPAQWFGDTQWAESNRLKEKAIRKPLLPGLKPPKLQSAVSNGNFQAAKKRAGKMATAYEERVVGQVEVDARCERVELVPMLRVDILAPVMTDAYYAVLTFDPASTVTVTPGSNEKEASWLDQAWAAVASTVDDGDEEADITPNLLYKISAPGDREVKTSKGASELEAEPGRIRLGFYDASLELEIGAGTRSALQEQSIQLIQVSNLKQRLSGAAEPRAEVEFHPFGLVDQYEMASDLYEPNRLA